MAAQCRILALLTTVWCLTALSSLGAPVSPTDSHWLLCQTQEWCGGRPYDPLHYCCYDDAVVPLLTTRGCGKCTFRVCFEQCCFDRLPSQSNFTVRARDHPCTSEPKPGDKICHS